MSHLSEDFVRHQSVKFLERHYRFRARKRKVYTQEEATTKQRYGRKRADGLLAFKHLLWGTYVVSVEAKSIKTLPAIQPYSDYKRLLKNALKMGFYFCILSGAIFSLIKMDNIWVQFMLPLNALLLGAVFYAVLSFNSHRHQLIKVIDQVRQYPANEQWLAFSKDSVEALSKKKQKQLKAICKAQGIGLILVSSRRRIRIKVKAKRNLKWGSYLKYYSRQKQIEQQLSMT